jgi:hypothetical protein
VSEVKVRFELEILEDGFPPVGVETLNARLVDANSVVLDNTPFFAESVAVGDLLRCSETNHDHIVQFERVLSPSGNKSISIIFIDDDCKEEIYQYFKSNDCYCEYGEFDGFNMLAVSIEREMDYDKLATYLDEKEELGKISYAELCI